MTRYFRKTVSVASLVLAATMPVMVHPGHEHTGAADGGHALFQAGVVGAAIAALLTVYAVVRRLQDNDKL